MADPPPLWILLPSGQRASGEWIDDTLRERASEAGLLHKVPLAARFPRQRVEVVRGPDPEAEVNRRFYLRGWTDGLPIVPPTLGRVEEALSWAPAADAADAVLGELDPLKGLATVEKVAANAVMAGCRPEFLPVVIAAVRAIADPAFNLRGVQTTDENVTPLVVVCGPVAEAIGMNASFGALGPGWQANAAIGRAVRLVMNNIGGGWPAAVSFAGLGQPGRYTLCLAERTELSPWPPLHVELGFAAAESAVVALRAESVMNVTGGLDDLASVMGSAASGFTMLHGGVAAVVIAPFVAKELAEAGAIQGRRQAAPVARRATAGGRVATDMAPRTPHRGPPVAGLGAGGGARGRDPRRRDSGGPRRPRRGRRHPHPAVRVLPLVGVPALPRLAPRRAPVRLGHEARTHRVPVARVHTGATHRQRARRGRTVNSAGQIFWIDSTTSRVRVTLPCHFRSNSAMSCLIASEPITRFTSARVPNS